MTASQDISGVGRELFARLLDTTKLLAAEVADPGTEALSAIYCAEQALLASPAPIADRGVVQAAALLIKESLYHLRLDTRSEDYHRRAEAFFRNHRLAHCPTASSADIAAHMPSREWLRAKIDADPDLETEARSDLPTSSADPAWSCAARKQTLPEPGECDWPTCGCDPAANKVLEALDEQGLLRSLGTEPGTCKRCGSCPVNAEGICATCEDASSAGERETALQEADWSRQAATYTLDATNNPIPVRDAEGASIEHAAWMLGEIVSGEIEGRKAHRWLGYAQALLVGGGYLTLEEAKLANKRASDETALSPILMTGKETGEAIANDLLSAIGDWSRPTGANGMIPAGKDHPLMVAAAKARAALTKDPSRG